MKLNFAFRHRYLMKLKPAIGIPPILVIGFFLSYTPAIGQDFNEGQTTEIEASAKEALDDPEPGETEYKPAIKPANTVRDSVSLIKVVKPAPKATSDKSQKQEDPLSFNFLYYIIEKFKMSDMIE